MQNGMRGVGWAVVLGVLGARAAEPPLTIQRSETGEVVLSYVVPSASRAVLETSADLTDWQARYAFETGEGRGMIHLPEEGAWRFFRVRRKPFRTPAGLVWVPPGDFLMGSSEYEEGREADEGPPHRVRIDKGFWMGATEVSIREFVSVMHFNPTTLTADSSVAVHRVSFAEAEEYCRRLTLRRQNQGLLPPGTAYRLPSEAEWEYACRAGTRTRFNFGDDPDYSQLPNYAWCRLNCGSPMPVGTKRPNAWGLYDLHGNVFEWCLGWYTPYPHGTRHGSDKLRNYRGGSFYCPVEYLRSASRHPGSEERSELIGFRVVLGTAAETVAPLNEVAPPAVTIEWASDGTWARVTGASATPESVVHYSTHTWRPTLGCPVAPPVVTAPTTVQMVAFRENFTRSPVTAITILQTPPPKAWLEKDRIRVEVPPESQLECAFADGEWTACSPPIFAPPGTLLALRARRPGWLTSPVARLPEAGSPPDEQRRAEAAFR